MYFEKELLPLMLIHKFNMVYFAIIGLCALIAQVIGEVLKGIGSDRPIPFDMRIITGWNGYIYEIIVIYLIFYIVNRFVWNKSTKEVLLWVSALAICFVALYFFKNGRREF